MAGRKKQNQLTRAELEQRYGHLYRKFYLIDEERCLYCGMPKQSLDHVPALSWVGAYGSEYFVNYGYKFLLVPCCSECNNWLGSLKKFTLLERVTHVENKIWQKYEPYINGPVWEEDEIAEMGRKFRQTLRNAEVLRITSVRRMDYARNIQRMLADDYSMY